MRRPLVAITTFLILALLFAGIGKVGNVYAAVYDNRGGFGACSGTSTQSYFDNKCYLWDYQDNHGIGFVLPPYNYDPNQLALQPVWNQNTSDGMRSALIQLLQNYANSGDAKKATGAAFIINTMLGRNGDQANAAGGRSVSPGDMSDVITRLSTATFSKSIDYPGPPDTGGDYQGGVYDVDFTTTNATPSGNYLYIKQGGVLKYVLDFGCANPVGGLSGLDYVNQWLITGKSQLGVGRSPNVPSWPSAAPGQTITWAHTLTNNGPNDTDRAIGYKVEKSGFVNNAWGNGTDPNNELPNGSVPGIGARQSYTTPGDYTAYKVRQDDVGHTLCQWVAYWDYRWDWPQNHGPDDPNFRLSNQSCVSIPYNYDLTPSVFGPNGVGTVGSSIPAVTPQVSNMLAGNATSTTKSPDDTTWQLKRIEVPPSGTIPQAQTENTNDPCTQFSNGNRNACIDKGSGTMSFPAGTTGTPPLPTLAGEVIDPNMPVGSKICYTLSVKSYSQVDVTKWRHSAPVCVTVSKKPKIQVWSSDLRTRGNIVTGLTSTNSGGVNSVFGSWVEYGGYSVGSNTGFSSGSGLKSGATLAGSPDTWNRLTFANVDASGTSKFGNLMALPSLPPLADQFMSQAPTGTLAGNATSVDLPSGIYKTGNITITDSTVGQEANGHGKTVVIIASGTVTIGGNITYSGPVAGNKFNSIDQLPQVIIIAGSIAVQGNVTEVDAWLLTPKTGDGSTNTINTCSDVPLGTSLTSNDCNKRLQINGPVSTQHLYLRRTAGSDTVSAAGDPAEVFNLRPDTYMWAYGRSTQAGKVQTVYSVEMPPRF